MRSAALRGSHGSESSSLSAVATDRPTAGSTSATSPMPMPMPRATAGGSQPASRPSGAALNPGANSTVRDSPPSASPASSMRTRFPALPSVVAAARPLAPAPITMASSGARDMSAPPARHDLERGEPPGGAHDAAPGMRPRTALPVALDRRPVLRPRRRWPEEKELMQRELALEDVPLGQPGNALDVGRREHLAVPDDGPDVRRVALERVDHRVTERLTLLVGPPTGDPVGRVLYEYAHDVLAWRRHPGVDHRRDHDVHVRV